MTAKNPWHWYRLARRLEAAGRPRAAAEAIQRGLALDDSIGDLHALMARLLILHNQRLEALRAVQNAMRHGCQDAAGWEDAAVCASLLGRHYDAGTAFVQALKRRPNDITLLCNAAGNASHLGRIRLARQRLQKAVQLAPENARAWWMLASVDEQPDALVDALEKRWCVSVCPRDRRYLAFALARAYEALRDPEQAWFWADTANRLVRKQHKHDQAAWLSACRARHAAQRELPALPSPLPVTEGPRPLFIVGLPRAGSSLLESMLAAHDDIQALGELPEFPLALAQAVPDGGCPDLSGLGTDYLDRVKAIHAPTAQWFTDKLPDNAWRLGFILASLPQARAVIIDKHPMDASWSLYKQLFAAEQKGWSYYLPWLGQVIAEHHRQRDYWRERASDRVFFLEYASLVADPESCLRRLQSFLGLSDQTERMLVGQGQAVTATASAAQVREKIHRRALGRWRFYQTGLEPARQAMQASGLEI